MLVNLLSVWSHHSTPQLHLVRRQKHVVWQFEAGASQQVDSLFCGNSANTVIQGLTYSLWEDASSGPGLFIEAPYLQSKVLLEPLCLSSPKMTCEVQVVAPPAGHKLGINNLQCNSAFCTLSYIASTPFF